MGEPQNVQIVPFPSVAAPAGWAHPVAQTFELVRDERYIRGWVAVTSFDQSKRAEILQRQLRIQTPPIHTVLAAGKFEHQAIPGLIKAQAGVSYCEAINGDPDNTVTIAACHTLDSLRDVLSPEVHAELL